MPVGIGIGVGSLVIQAYAGYKRGQAEKKQGLCRPRVTRDRR